MEGVSLVSGLLNLAGSKLASKIFCELSSALGVKKDLRQLLDLVEEIKMFLHNVGGKVIKNDPSFTWLNRLKEIAYSIDDLLNDFHMEAEKQKAKEIDREKLVMVKCFCGRPKSIWLQHKMANKIKTIREKFEAIITERKDFNTLRDGLPMDSNIDRQVATGELPSLTVVDEITVFGREHDRSNIIYELTKSEHQEVIVPKVNDQEMVPVMSIIGLGGSGKTTLAKLVFNDEIEIKKHFEVRVWVYVSQKFDVCELIGKLFEAITDQKSENHPLQSMSRVITEQLSGKRFLLVMDDIWNKDLLDWEQFLLHLKAGAAGSRILLTTRSQEVAEILNSTLLYNLRALSVDDSWKLFLQSSGRAKEYLDSEFIEIGRDIVRKCGGVPLAVKALGGIVGSKKEINSWRAVKESQLWDVDDRVFTSLWLSYFHLPAYLQQCFLLCSIFPKGYLIDKDHLIAQWIAHGLVIPINELEQLEDVGNDYFDSLLKISFLQDTVQNKYTALVTCKMHDLVHDLARRILQDEIVVTPEKAINDPSQSCRYLSLTKCFKNIDRKLIRKARALFVCDGAFIFDKPIREANRVCSVILEHVYTVSLSPAIAILKFEFLGYLRMTHLQSETLPEAISSCWNLQALHVTDCHQLLRLPESIGKLKKLRSLDLSGDWKLEGLPQSIGDCDNLHSLRLISCVNLAIMQFRMPQNLQSLNLNACPRITQLPNSVVQLEMLKSLNLSFCSYIQELPSSFNWCELHALKLSWTKLARLPDGIMNLRRLKELDLEGCDELCGMPLGIGQLTQLQRLTLFVVGDGREYATMSELHGLVMLSGDLEIKNIRYIRGSDYDGEKAYLSEKNGLQELKLQWHSSSRDIDMEQELALLNRLQPPPGIRKLCIYGYPGQQFASWITKQNESSFSLEGTMKQSVPPPFSHLSHMELADYTNLKHLSGLVNLPSLNTLKLENMSVLESIGGGPFPSLKTLHIKKMPHFSVCSIMTNASSAHGKGGESNHEEVRSFPCMTTLEIIECPNLTMKPSFPSSLESLVLTSSNTGLLLPPGSPDLPDAITKDLCSASTSTGIMLPSSPLLKALKIRRIMVLSSGWGLLQQFIALQSLEISSCNDLSRLPESMKKLTSLQQLKIWNCASLQILPDWIGELGSLRMMDIRSCTSLSSLPQSMVQLNALQYLTIGYCDALELPEWLGKLQSLRSLDIWGLPKLTCLPATLQQLTTLQDLKISCFDALSVLPEWLGEISALRRLKIETCPGLTSLPSSMKRLTGLQELEIIRCPELRRRYRKGEGQDWDLISHIPHVHIQRITDED